MSVLLNKQFLMAQYVPALIEHALYHGYTVKLGGALRIGDPRCHGMSLAIDLLLFKDGKYLTKYSDYEFLGLFWKSLNPLCRWGGDFKGKNAGDGNHFSITHNGKS